MTSAAARKASRENSSALGNADLKDELRQGGKKLPTGHKSTTSMARKPMKGQKTTAASRQT
jgi:hypothetical protein